MMGFGAGIVIGIVIGIAVVFVALIITRWGIERGYFKF